MIKESREKEECEDCNEYKFDIKKILLLAIATSIDALAIGVTFAFLKVNVLFATLCIAIITFAISFCGVRIGNIFGSKYKSKAELFGGMVLICIGLQILLEHLSIL